MNQNQDHSFPEPSSSRQARTGVLFVHGYNGDRSDMAELAEAVSSSGMMARNMVLPGHERPVHEMLAFGWSDWADAVHKEALLLKTHCERVFLVGHSLGGSLVLHTAVSVPVDGVIALCPPLRLYPWSKPFLSLIKYVTPYLPTLTEDIHDPEARHQASKKGYRWTPVKPAESMLQGLSDFSTELPSITVPTMILASTQDHVVPIRDCREIYHLLGSRDKELILFHQSYHVIMKDYDRKDVLSHIQAFIERICAKGASDQAT